MTAIQFCTIFDLCAVYSTNLLGPVQAIQYVIGDGRASAHKNFDGRVGRDIFNGLGQHLIARHSQLRRINGRVFLRQDECG